MKACGKEQLSSGLPAGIEGGVHQMQELWKKYEDEPNVGFLLVDAKNAFNTMNRINQCWTIRHLVPESYRFYFNRYSHHRLLRIMPVEHGQLCVDLLSAEGCTQGCPLSMPMYGIGTLPLIRKLAPIISADNDGAQCWYADDATLVGDMDSTLMAGFDLLEKNGGPYGYHANAKKTRLLVREDKLAEAKEKYGNKFKEIVTDFKHLGVPIGTNQGCEDSLNEQIAVWAKEVEILGHFAINYPQSAQVLMQRVQQAKWTYCSRTNKGVGKLFQPIEDAIRHVYLPNYFGETIVDETQDQLRRDQAALPYKFGGVSIPDPTREADRQYLESKTATQYLVDAMNGKIPFDQGSYQLDIKEKRKQLNESHAEMYKIRRDALLERLGPRSKRVCIRAGESSNARSVYPTVFGGTILHKVPYRDSLNLAFGRKPMDLNPTCDGCNEDMTVSHALTCPFGGMTQGRHNLLRDELGLLSQSALTKSQVRKEPMIFTPAQRVRAQQSRRQSSSKSGNNDNSLTPKVESTSDEDLLRGDLLIHDLNEPGIETIIDITVIDTDSPSYVHIDDPLQVMRQRAKQKRDKYNEACKDNNRIFIPFVMSADGCFDKEAKSVMRNIANRLAVKWDRPVSVCANYVYSRMSVALVRANHRCFRGSRMPSTFISSALDLPQIEDGAGLRAYEMLF